MLFGRNRTVIGRHLRNIFKEGELDEKSVRAKFAHTASDGKTYTFDFYNLDAIISIGYRVKSENGIIFRKWAIREIYHLDHNWYLINNLFQVDSLIRWFVTSFFARESIA